MDRDAILSRLKGNFWKSLECHAEIGSTNDRARELLDVMGSRAGGSVVVAASQSSGRGRLGRRWVCGDGKSLAMSVALWPPAASATGCLPLAGALAVARALAEAGVACRLKWPNDVMAGERKIAGVLAESRFSGDSLQGSVLGMGVNAGQSAEDFPPEVRRSATSVKLESGAAPTIEDLAASVLNELGPLIELAFSAPPSLAACASDCWIHKAGDHLRVVTSEGAIEGRFISIGDGGELLIERGGKTEKFLAGDVERLRRGGQS